MNRARLSAIKAGCSEPTAYLARTTRPVLTPDGVSMRVR